MKQTASVTPLLREQERRAEILQREPASLGRRDTDRQRVRIEVAEVEQLVPSAGGLLRACDDGEAGRHAGSFGGTAHDTGVADDEQVGSCRYVRVGGKLSRQFRADARRVTDCEREKGFGAVRHRVILL